MDLLSVTPCETARLQLEHPTTGAKLVGDDGQPITLELAGADSVAFRAASRSISNARIERPKGEKMTAEQFDADGLSVLAACVMGWSSNFSIGGACPEYSKDKAREILERFPWLREQADRFIAQRANFLPKA